jgi:LDH2 family malate/lactate/ureidoglycolate dehydrogenase
MTKGRTMTTLLYDASALRAFTLDLLTAAGLPPGMAAPMARYLVEADLMGHDTHGMALLPWYLQDIESGLLPRTGTPEILRDRPAAVAWRGHRLAGAWLVVQAMDLAIGRAREFGSCTIAVSDTHHIGALATYLHRATDLGMMASITSSSPSGAMVAPFGGSKGVYTPDPVAYGIPTPDGPILIDISASITTYNMALRLMRERRGYPGDWVLTASGQASRDPKDLTEGGTLLPTGGLDHGQKGYGMALFAEALTQGLGGHGRADQAKGTQCAFTLQVWDPEAFAGTEAFLRQTGWLADACRACPPLDPKRPVRLPGDAALARKAKALERGLALYPSILPLLRDPAAKLGVALPQPL